MSTGHPSSDALNAVCPYYTMYPLDFPLRVLQRNAGRGTRVLDPFCGRGTTNFAARLLGLPSFGIDSSPVAAALSQAKLVPTTAGRVTAGARAILETAGAPAAMPTGAFWKLAFHPRTLTRLCSLREALLDDCSSASRIFLRAIILGALHGPRPRGRPSHFSNQAPRTFAPKPAYAVRFWRKRRMRPEDVDVLAILATRAERYLAARLPDVEGAVRLADARDDSAFGGVRPVDWIITSPPYYGMRTYLQDQWLRAWFLGGPDHVDYEHPPGQLEHTGADHFARDLGRVWRNVRGCAKPSARLVVRFGGIHDRDADPMEVLAESLRLGGWRIRTARRVPVADAGRRQVTQFHASPRPSITEHDVYCAPA